METVMNKWNRKTCPSTCHSPGYIFRW